jgi:hypothetical protein
MKSKNNIQSFREFNENLNISDVSYSDLKKGIDSLGHTYYYKESEKDGYIDIAQKDKLGRIVGWMTVKFGTGIFK